MSRETTPIWVWMAMALMAMFLIAYFSGVFMMEGMRDGSTQPAVNIRSATMTPTPRNPVTMIEKTTLTA